MCDDNCAVLVYYLHSSSNKLPFLHHSNISSPRWAVLRVATHDSLKTGRWLLGILLHQSLALLTLHRRYPNHLNWQNKIIFWKIQWISCHDNLTVNYSYMEINFLHTPITIQNSSAQTSMFRKPKNLRWDCFCPKYNKLSIAYSQPIRCHHICSSPTDEDEHLNQLERTFLNQSYHPTVLKLVSIRQQNLSSSTAVTFPEF